MSSPPPKEPREPDFRGSDPSDAEQLIAGGESSILTPAEAEKRWRFYETILSNTPDFVYTFDLDHRFTYANRSLLNMWGRTWKEAIGKNCLELGYEPWHAAMHDREIEQVVATGQPIRGEVPFTGTNGERIYDYIFVPVLGPSGQVIAIAGTTRDVTNRKRNDTLARFLARASAELAELTDPQTTLQRIASTAVPAFADWSVVDYLREDGTLHRVAVTHSDPEKVRCARELFERYPPRAEDPHGVPHVLRTGVSEWFEEVSDSHLDGLAHDEVHRQFLRSLGVRSIISVPLRQRGRPLGVLSFFLAESGGRYTHTDLRAAEDLGRRAAVTIENALLYHELREADRRKDEFLATLAHELRNPLAPIRSALQLLEENGGDSKTTADARHLMERQLRQLVHLVDDLLDVSRITRGTIELRRERVSLADVVQSALEISGPLIQNCGHRLEVELPPGRVDLDADPVRLAQIISNLLNNSARYTEPAGEIQLRASREGNQAVVCVRDNGIGISPEMLPRIFDMFTQAEPNLDRAQSGLGIGLTLVKRLVEMHGGSVSAASRGLGLGSEFVVRLPIAEGVPAIAAVPLPRADVVSIQKRRILVVDDNRDAASTLAKLLERAGHSVCVAFEGLEAVDAAAAFQPEVVLLDIGLPGLNGYDVARRLREDVTASPVTLIALTGWGQEEDRRKAREAGFDHHLVKPIDYEELKGLLARLPRSAGE